MFCDQLRTGSQDGQGLEGVAGNILANRMLASNRRPAPPSQASPPSCKAPPLRLMRRRVKFALATRFSEELGLMESSLKSLVFDSSLRLTRM